MALDRVLGGEAVAAEDLQRLVGDEVERLGAEHLQDRRLDRVLLDRLAAPAAASRRARRGRSRRRRRPSARRSGSSCCRRRRCASPCRRACAGSCRSSRSAGRTACARARSRARPARHSLAAPTAPAPSLKRPMLRMLKAILCPWPISPSTCVGGDAGVLEDELARRRAADAELVLLGPGATGRASSRSTRNAVNLLAVDLGEDGEEVGEAGVGDELLGAGQAIAAVRLRVRRASWRRARRCPSRGSVSA